MKTIKDIIKTINQFHDWFALSSYQYERVGENTARFELFNLGWSLKEIDWLCENIDNARQFFVIADNAQTKLQFFVDKVDFNNNELPETVRE